MKKFFKLFSVLLIFFALVACGNDKIFKEKDFKITLSNDFKKSELEDYTYYYESDGALVTVLEETLEELEEFELTKESTAKDYMDLIVKLNEKDDKIIEENGFVYIEYTASVEENEFYYLTTAYKADNSFWLISFMCNAEDKSLMHKKFLSWAKSIEV